MALGFPIYRTFRRLLLTWNCCRLLGKSGWQADISHVVRIQWLRKGAWWPCFGYAANTMVRTQTIRHTKARWIWNKHASSYKERLVAKASLQKVRRDFYGINEISFISEVRLCCLNPPATTYDQHLSVKFCHYVDLVMKVWFLVGTKRTFSRRDRYHRSNGFSIDS